MKVTRDVISDLWPLYASGEASADTRALVDAYLAENPEAAQTLRATLDLPGEHEMPQPDVEVKALNRTRELIRGNSWMRGVRLVALALTALAFIRSLDGTLAATPRVFIGNVVIATICWTWYLLWLSRARRQALRA